MNCAEPIPDSNIIMANQCFDACLKDQVQVANQIVTMVGVVVAVLSLVAAAVSTRNNAKAIQMNKEASMQTARTQQARFLLDLRNTFMAHHQVATETIRNAVRVPREVYVDTTATRCAKDQQVGLLCHSLRIQTANNSTSRWYPKRQGMVVGELNTLGPGHCHHSSQHSTCMDGCFGLPSHQRRSPSLT